MSTPRQWVVVLISFLVTMAVAGSFAWYTIDRSAPLIYLDAWFEALPAPGETSAARIEAARPGETVVLALKIKWQRTNCSTELERRFIGSDGSVHKVARLPSDPARLGPPPKQFLSADGSIVSRRRVVLPDDLPDGQATHSPNAWERCIFPAEKWGDYLTDIWPIFVGPKGADAKIMIRR